MDILGWDGHANADLSGGTLSTSAGRYDGVDAGSATLALSGTAAVADAGWTSTCRRLSGRPWVTRGSAHE